MEHAGVLKELLGMLIPILAIVLGIGMGMWSAWLGYRRRSEALRLYHAERMAAIEKGIELPPAPLLLEQQRGGEPGWSRHRRHGLILLLVGVAVCTALWSAHDGDYLWGLVPAGLGLALLLAAVMEAREQPRPGAPGPGSQGPGNST